VVNAGEMCGFFLKGIMRGVSVMRLFSGESFPMKLEGRFAVTKLLYVQKVSEGWNGGDVGRECKS